MNSASTLRPAQNNSADSEIYIQGYMQDYMQSIYTQNICRFTGGGRCSDAVLVVRRRTVKVKSMHRATSPDDSVLSTSSNSSDNIRQYIRQYQTISDNTRGTPAGSRQADDQSCAVARPVRRRQLRFQIRCAVREGEVSTAPVVGQHVESISFATKPTLPATV